MKALTFLVVAQLSSHAAPEPSQEAAVFQCHFTDRELRRYVAGGDKPDAPIVLDERPSTGVFEPGRDWKGPLRKSAEKLGKDDLKEAVEDFISKNGSPSSFKGSVIPGFRVLVIPKEELRAIFSDHVSGWDLFRKKFDCSSSFTLSRVGFSKDGRTALYFGYVQHDWIEGHGEFHVLRKKDEKWTKDTTVSIGWSIQS